MRILGCVVCSTRKASLGVFGFLAVSTGRSRAGTRSRRRYHPYNAVKEAGMAGGGSAAFLHAGGVGFLGLDLVPQ